MSDLDWVAGFFDGEGCVYISKTNRGQHKVNFAQKDRYLLDLVESILQCEGGIYPTGKNNSSFFLSYTGTKAIKVAQILVPHLRNPHKVDKLRELFEAYGIPFYGIRK